MIEEYRDWNSLLLKILLLQHGVLVQFRIVLLDILPKLFGAVTQKRLKLSGVFVVQIRKHCMWLRYGVVDVLNDLGSIRADFQIRHTRYISRLRQIDFLHIFVVEVPPAVLRAIAYVKAREGASPAEISNGHSRGQVPPLPRFVFYWVGDGVGGTKL